MVAFVLLVLCLSSTMEMIHSAAVPLDQQPVSVLRTRRQVQSGGWTQVDQQSEDGKLSARLLAGVAAARLQEDNLRAELMSTSVYSQLEVDDKKGDLHVKVGADALLSKVEDPSIKSKLGAVTSASVKVTTNNGIGAEVNAGISVFENEFNLGGGTSLSTNVGIGLATGASVGQTTGVTVLGTGFKVGCETGVSVFGLGLFFKFC